MSVDSKVQLAAALSRSVNAFVVALYPLLQYKVVVVGTKQGGGTTPPSNTLNFVTPAAG